MLRPTRLALLLQVAPPALDSTKCVRADLVEPCGADRTWQYWNDYGSGVRAVCWLATAVAAFDSLLGLLQCTVLRLLMRHSKDACAGARGHACTGKA